MMEKEKPKEHYPATIHFATSNSGSKVTEGKAGRRPGGKHRTSFKTVCSAPTAPTEQIHGKDGIV